MKPWDCMCSPVRSEERKRRKRVTTAVMPVLRSEVEPALGVGKKQLKHWKLKLKSLSRVRLCDPTDCSLPGSSVHGTFQAGVLEWVAISFSRGSSQLEESVNGPERPEDMRPELTIWGDRWDGMSEDSTASDLWVENFFKIRHMYARMTVKFVVEIKDHRLKNIKYILQEKKQNE